MKKNDPRPSNAPLHETTERGLRLQLVTWQQEEARLERLRQERTRSARAIYIPPFPVSQDPAPSARRHPHVPAGLRHLN